MPLSCHGLYHSSRESRRLSFEVSPLEAELRRLLRRCWRYTPERGSLSRAARLRRRSTCLPSGMVRFSYHSAFTAADALATAPLSPPPGKFRLRAHWPEGRRHTREYIMSMPLARLVEFDAAGHQLIEEALSRRHRAPVLIADVSRGQVA